MSSDKMTYPSFIKINDMFCTQCGQKNPDNFKFCRKCGNPLRKPSVSSLQSEAIIEDKKNDRKDESLVTPGSSVNNNLSGVDKEELNNLKNNPEEVANPQNQYDEDGNLILPKYEEEKKHNIGIILGLIAAAIIMAGGIVSYHFYVDSVPFLSPYMKSKPEIEVKNFAKKFAQLAEQNNRSELTALYPDIAEADSIALQYDPNEIIIENFDGVTYEIRLSSGALINVIAADENNYKVISSRGLFAYPEDKIGIALKTGMYEYRMTDKEFNHRMKNDRFFDYLKKRSRKNLENLISVNPELIVTNPNMGEGYFSVRNNSNVTIPGSAYTVRLKSTRPYINWDTGEITPNVEYEDLSGVTLSPKGKGKIEINFSVNTGGEDLEFENIQWNISPEELQGNLIKYTGNEYKEYIESGSNIELTPEQEVIKFLYSVYYKPEYVKDNNSFGQPFYTQKMLSSFKENHITSSLPSNKLFSKDFEEVSDRFKRAEAASGEIWGFDYDYVWDTQDINFNNELEIISIKQISPDRFEIKTKFINSPKTFIIIKENSDWKIDNIDYIKDEMREMLEQNS